MNAEAVDPAGAASQEADWGGTRATIDWAGEGSDWEAHRADQQSQRLMAQTLGRQEASACVPHDGEGITEVIDGSNGRIRAEWDVGRCSVRVRIRQTVRFGIGEDRVAFVSPEGRFELLQTGMGPDRELTVTAGPEGEPEYRLEVDGDDVPMDAESEAWLAALIPAIYRVTGWDAKSRVDRLYRQGGTDAVMEEVRQIASDHVAGIYLRRILASSNLSDAEIEAVFAVAGERIQSDHELTEILIDAWRPGLSARTRASFLAAARSLQSDYELGRAIAAFMEQSPSTEEAVAVVQLANGLQSDHELGQVLNAVLERADADPTLRRAVLEAARGLDSDYELAELLVDMGRSSGPGTLESELFLELVSGLASDYELGRTLKEILVHPDMDAKGLLRVADLSASIASDYEQAELLQLMIREHSPLPDEVSDRVVEAATSLASDYERDRVISLLVRSSR